MIFLNNITIEINKSIEILFKIFKLNNIDNKTNNKNCVILFIAFVEAQNDTSFKGNFVMIKVIM